MTTQIRVKNLDVVCIGLGMFIGFCIILMHLTGMWPCQILATTSQTIDIDKFQNSKEPFTAFAYDIHYWIKDLFQCS